MKKKLKNPINRVSGTWEADRWLPPVYGVTACLRALEKLGIKRGSNKYQERNSATAGKSDLVDFCLYVT